MLSYLENAGLIVLTAIFCILLVYTLIKVVILILDTGFNSKKPLGAKIWILFLWLVFTAPFVTLIYMITTRNPEMDKAIKKKAFQQDTQHLKRPPRKPIYNEPLSK